MLINPSRVDPAYTRVLNMAQDIHADNLVNKGERLSQDLMVTEILNIYI